MQADSTFQDTDRNTMGLEGAMENLDLADPMEGEDALASLRQSMEMANDDGSAARQTQQQKRKLTGKSNSNSNKPDAPLPDLKKRKTTRSPAPVNVFRSFVRFPDILKDPQAVGAFIAHTHYPAEFSQRVIQAAEAKFDAVYQGRQSFGQGIVVKSIPAEPFKPLYQLSPTLPTVLFLNYLFSGNAVSTEKGKTSVFPVTVYRMPGERTKGLGGGQPCLMVHLAHTKTALWRRWSACRKTISNQVLREALTPFALPYDLRDNAEQITVSGFEPYNHDLQNLEGGFMLIPAHWLDVMKYLVMHPNGTLRDLSQVLTNVYAHLPELQGKFDDEFRCLWLGEERDSNVKAMIKDCHLDHTCGMARARAFDKIINTNDGQVWILPPLSQKTKLTQYNQLSFAYGVQCWKEQLQGLNTAYAFFTGEAVSAEAFHMHSLMVKDEITPVLSREECRRNGIFNAPEASAICHAIRVTRYRLKTRYGSDFAVNFWGSCK